MGHPQDNSQLLTTADQIREYEFTRGFNSRDDEVNDLKTQLKDVTDAYVAYKAADPGGPHNQPSTPTPPVVQAKLGAAWKSGESLPAPVTKIDCHRFFFPPGKMMSAQTWSGQKPLVAAHDQEGCRTFSISFKPDTMKTTFSAQSLANVENFLKSRPMDVKAEDMLITFFHEHNGDIRDGTYTLDLYKKGSKEIADLAHKMGMKYGPIHNGNNRQNGATGPWGLWPDEWAKAEADVSLYDFWGVDCYSDGYENCSPRMDPIKKYADGLRLPVLIGEMASPAADPVKQEAWCKQARTWALKNTRWANYWSSQVDDTKTNYRLSDGAAKAWFGI